MPRRALARAARGFSLVELAISIGVIAASLIGLLVLFIALIKASQKSVDLAVGTTVAAAIMDKYVYSTGFNVIQQEIESAGSSPIRDGAENLSNGRFLYEITGKKIMPGQILRLDIAVWWWQTDDQKTEARPEYGMLKKELTRFVTRKR